MLEMEMTEMTETEWAEILGVERTEMTAMRRPDFLGMQ